MGRKRKAPPIHSNKRYGTAVELIEDFYRILARKKAYNRNRTRYGSIRSRYRRKGKRRITVAEKALKNIGFSRFYNSFGDRFTSENGIQEFRLASRGMDNEKLVGMLRNNFSFTPGVSANYKMYIKLHHKQFYIVNSCNNQTVVYLYEMLCKRDGDRSILNDANLGDNTLAEGDVVKFTEDDVMYSPLGAPLVYANWKKIKTMKKILDPGQVWHVSITIPIRKYFNTINLLNESAGHCQKYLTSQTLLRAHGTPASYSANEGTVTISPCRIDFTTHEYITYKAVDTMANRTEVNSKLVTSAGALDLIVPETGIKDDYEEA